MALRALLDLASHEQRAGDVLLLTLCGAPSDLEAQVSAAHMLRDLMAFPAVVEVCDKTLSLAPEEPRALELAGLALGRMGRADEAIARLGLAEGLWKEGEAPALLARIAKQQWRAHWDREPLESMRERALAARDALLRAIRAYLAAHEALKARDGFAGLNAITLLEIALELLPDGDELFTVEWMKRRLAELRPEVEHWIDRTLRETTDTEARYWALASRAELVVSRQPAEAAAVASVKEDLFEAAELVRGRIFMLDSTRQQMALMARLMERNVLAVEAVRLLDRALDIHGRPDERRVRILILADGPHGVLPQHTPQLVTALERTLRAVVEKDGDAIAYVGGNAALDVPIAEACLAAGVPFVLHLPFDRARFADEVLGADESLLERFEAIAKDAVPAAGTRFAEPGGRVLSLPDHLGSVVGGDPHEAVREWVFATARCHGMRRVVLVALPDDGAGTASSKPSEGFSRRVQKERGRVIRLVHGSQGPHQSLPATRTLVVPSIPTIPSGPLPSVAPIPTISFAPPPADVPHWLVDLRYPFQEAGGEWAERWNGYLTRSEVVNFLRSLDLKFEPVEQLRPALTEPMLVGFEVLGADRSGGNYKRVLDEGRRLGVAEVDLDLTLFAFGLQCVRRLRVVLIDTVEPRLAMLWYTLNVNHAMVESPVLDLVIRRYFEPALAEHVQLELSENFPEGIATVRGEAREKLLGTALDQLGRLLESRQLRLVLDDSNALNPSVRMALIGRATKSKADSAYVRQLFEDFFRKRPGPGGHEMTDADLLSELARFRIEGSRDRPARPYVLEGVEDDRAYDWLERNWPKRRGVTYIQGWRIRLREPLTRVFLPMHTADQPRGYRIADAHRSSVWLA